MLDAAAEEAVVEEAAPPQAVRAAAAAAAPQMDRNELFVDLFHNNISFNWADPFVLGRVVFSPCQFSLGRLISAHPLSSCDQGGAKRQ